MNMPMISSHDTEKIRKRVWFFVLKDNESPANHEKQLIEQLDKFALKRQNTSWAMNSRYGYSEGVAVARIVVMLQNACSLMTLRKAFKSPQCRLDLKVDSIISFLTDNGKTDKETLVTSKNWSWENMSGRNDLISNDCQKGPTINLTVNNLFIVADDESKKALLEALKQACR